MRSSNAGNVISQIFDMRNKWAAHPAVFSQISGRQRSTSIVSTYKHSAITFFTAGSSTSSTSRRKYNVGKEATLFYSIFHFQYVSFPLKDVNVCVGCVFVSSFNLMSTVGIPADRIILIFT
jgi:hypothetical protein